MKKTNRILFLLGQIAISVCLLLPKIFSINKTVGSDFLDDPSFNYSDYFGQAILMCKNNNIDFKIVNHEAVVSKNSFVYRIQDETTKNYNFEFRFIPNDTNEFDSTLKHFYAKSYTVGNDLSKSFSFCLMNKQKLVSYIYDPTKYQSYTYYTSRIEGNFNHIEDNWSLYNLIDDNGNIKQDELNHFLNKIATDSIKANNSKNIINYILFWFLLELFTLVIFCIIKLNPSLFFFFSLLSLALCYCLDLLLNLDYQIILFLSSPLSLFLALLTNLIWRLLHEPANAK